MDVQWTEEQQKVIRLRNRNILVSAAAGSGKTAVLVERIIQMLTQGKHPVDVDRLLIVTFTEAAAAEMKERIRTAIERKLEEHPENVHLQRQATLIHSAQITTIHSFCLSVIREHFHVLGIDPGFRIAEEGELKLLKQDVLEELLEACYAEGEKAFLEFAEKLGSGRDDRKLEERILQLYEYSRSYPRPGRWLQQCAENYQTEAGSSMQDTPVFQQAIGQVHRHLTDLQELLDRGLEICREADGPYMYEEMLESDRKALERIAEAGNFEKMYEAVCTLTWKRLSSKKDETVSAEKREQVKLLREQVKKGVKDLSAAYFYEEPAELFRDMADSRQTMEVFVSLVQRFADAFAEKKQSKNLIDFNDMEQFALKILTEEQDGKLVPSASAREYQEQFAEVMIDEYQDSNLIQEAILTSVSTVCRGKNNIFMVGDVKQSIYRFRLSRPELFMEKYDTYDTRDQVEDAVRSADAATASKEKLRDNDRQRIDLHRNFRSRKEVLDSVNYVFQRLMRRELGGIVYDEQAALYPGAVFEPLLLEDGSSACETELLLLDTAGEDSDGEDAKEASEREGDPFLIKGTAKQLEARMIAKRIQELVQKGQVQDKKTGGHRRVQYRDIVILTRSIRGWADGIAAVLMEEGIPAYAGSREGYFEAYEIRVLLDYLKLLDNQKQDLPLAAVLTSPFAGLNAGEMAEIRRAFPEKAFHEAAENYAHTEEPDETENQSLRTRLEAFYMQLEHFREMVPYTAIHELLWKILEETGYGLYIAAMPGGAQRAANVEMLVEKAAAFEETSYKGLFHFVRYIEQLKKYDVDYGEANLADEQSDTVRIMSIHKSKGLEFPIVFTAGMGKRFNTQDVTGSILIHPEWGVGIDAVDLERRTKIPTILKKIIQREMMLENLGEELRVLYVAMTRAKEKLILTGTLPHAEEVLDGITRQNQISGKGGPLSYALLSGARTYLDWLLPAVCMEDAPVRILVETRSDLEGLTRAEEGGEFLAREVLEHWDVQRIYDAGLRTSLKEQAGFSYPYENAGKQKLKFTVSELKKREYLSEEGGEMALEEPDIIPLVPQFLQEEEELTGSSRGNAYHKLLELLDFTEQYDAEVLQNAIRKFRQEEKLSEDMAACIRIRDILDFLYSKSGRQMHQAALLGTLFKEQPFVLGVNAKEIYSQEAAEETILVQGIIDVYFEEDGELVVLDYKTDHGKTAWELREKYHAQLEYYARALEQLLGKKVKEKRIYSFTLHQEIII